jgi:hypothetical protein
VLRLRVSIPRLYSKFVCIAAPRGLPKAIVDVLGRTIARVVLVSNHEDRASLQALLTTIGRRDLLVQFNLCAHNAAIAPLNCQKLFVFRANGGSGTNFGYRPDALAFQGTTFATQRGQVSLLFVDNLPSTARAPVCLQWAARNAAAWSYVDSSDRPFNTYPVPAYKYAGPSTGFVTLQLLLDARQRLSQQGQPGFEIVLWGFKDAPGDRFWEGHNWRFERRFLRAHAAELKIWDGLDLAARASSPS